MSDARLTAVAIAGQVREAAAAGTSLRIVASGSWLAAGRPVRAEQMLGIRACDGVVDYVPGDLTMTVGAGTTLATLSETAAAENQWLALEPFGEREGTIGATVATASCGPLAAAFGAPRDQVLGVEVVTGEGEIIRGGGRVVKNVAGFDLTRLFTGCWGTLGVITEVSLRLRARPESDVTVALLLPAEAAACRSLLRRVRSTPVPLAAAEVLSPTLVVHLGLERDAGRGAILVRLMGNEDAVMSQQRALVDLAPSRVMESGRVWTELAACERAVGDSAIVARFSDQPALAPETWTYCAGAVERAGVPGFAQLSLQSGVGRVMLDASQRHDSADLATRSFPRRHWQAQDAGPARRVFERLPASAWPALAPPAAADRLSRRIREAFDPRGILNPGILG